MIVHVLACDYDGTIADHGHVSPEMVVTLARVRESGRKLVLVTGRVLPDLRHVCPAVDEMFDAVVAENGAVLYYPARREVQVIGGAPEPALIDGLRRREVPHDLGRSIVATRAQFAEESIAAIREAGVERTLVFNKGSLMLLPGGVTKATGLDACLAALGFSPHNVVGIGDGENDHAFLAITELAVAVADAVPALRERADHVTAEPGARGARRFIEAQVLADAATLVPGLARHHVTLGQRPDGGPVRLPAHATRLLVVGPAARGKTRLTGLLVAALVESERNVCLLDPEGDHQSLSDLGGLLVLGGRSDRGLPAADELEQFLRRPRTSLVLNLSALSRADKNEYGATVLAKVAAARAETGLPHWLIVEEAHHVLPAAVSPAVEALGAGREALCLITLSLDDLARDVHRVPNVLASTDLQAFDATLRTLRAERPEHPPAPPIGGPPLERGEAAITWLDDTAPGATRFTVARRRVEHRRPLRKDTAR